MSLGLCLAPAPTVLPLLRPLIALPDLGPLPVLPRRPVTGLELLPLLLQGGLPGPGEQLLLLPQQLLLGDAQVLQSRALSPPLGGGIFTLRQNLQ